MTSSTYTLGILNKDRRFRWSVLPMAREFWTAAQCIYINTLTYHNVLLCFWPLQEHSCICRHVWWWVCRWRVSGCIYGRDHNECHGHCKYLSGSNLYRGYWEHFEIYKWLSFQYLILHSLPFSLFFGVCVFGHTCLCIMFKHLPAFTLWWPRMLYFFSSSIVTAMTQARHYKPL